MARGVRGAKPRSFTVQIKAKTPKEQQLVDRLHDEVEFIAQLTVGGGTKEVVTLLLNLTIESCHQGMSPLAAATGAALTLRERFMHAVEAKLGRVQNTTPRELIQSEH